MLLLDALTLSTVSVILALIVLAENTLGLWKITQGLKTLQKDSTALLEGLKTLQNNSRAIVDGLKILQEGQKAIMESLERIKASAKEGDHGNKLTISNATLPRLKHGEGKS
ncbi:MAG: hypothetical protein QW186_05215 [Candidatus Bathyarchaeia archaeon]